MSVKWVGLAAAVIAAVTVLIASALSRSTRCWIATNMVLPHLGIFILCFIYLFVFAGLENGERIRLFVCFIL